MNGVSYSTNLSGFLTVTPALGPERRATLVAALPPGTSWRVSDDGARLEPAALETRTYYWKELQAVIDSPLKGWHCRVSGGVRWSGEQEGDVGTLSVIRGRVKTVPDEGEALTPEAARDILALLASGDVERMRRGFDILACLPLPLPGVVKTLLPLLDHPEPATRQCAIGGLIQVRATAARVIAALTACLADPHEWVRSAAAEALGQAGHQGLSAIPALERLRDDPSYGPRGRSREALTKLRDLDT